LAWWWKCADRLVRIAVGVFAVAGLYYAVPGLGSPDIGLNIAVLSVVVAIALNIVPISDWERKHAEMFSLWSELRKDASREDHKSCDTDDGKDANHYRSERLSDLDSKMESLHAMEPAPWIYLLRRCQHNENERLYGPKVRTYDDAMTEYVRRTQSTATA